MSRIPPRPKRLFSIEGRKMKPTKRHRPALWECMLGTLYAMNDEGEVRYFDYDWVSAREYAGVSETRDVRFWRTDRNYPGDGPRRGKFVLWIKRLGENE